MTPSQFDKLESFILDKMIETRLPGLSMALLHEGDVITRNFGFKDLASRTPPSSDTLFGLGSITKVFTAVAIMQLRDKGLLNLDDAVNAYFELDLEPSIQIKHLLSHSSGLPALGYSESKMSERWWLDGYPVTSLADILTFMQGAKNWAQAQAGERWFYLNEGYILLGGIIEQVSGQAYTSYIHDHILEPLGMQRSFFTREQVEQDPDHATPYLKERDGSFFVGSNLYSTTPAAGGLVSNTNDMLRFARMLLADPDVPTLLSQNALELMQTPVVALPQKESQFFAPKEAQQNSFFGLGLQIHQDFLGHTVISHGGGVMGGTTYLALMPERQLAVILLSNAHAYPMRQLALAALATLVGEDFRQLDFVRIDNLLHSLEGSYSSFRDTIQAKVSRRGDSLELALTFKHEDRQVYLHPVSFSEQRSRFSTFSNGHQQMVDFIHHQDKLELIFERYCFRKQGGTHARQTSPHV